MSDYLYRSADRLGRSLQGLGQTIIEADAERKYKDEALSIAQDIDAFKQSLYTDPDHGVPGSQNSDEAGYMGKWDEFSKQIEERINEVSNPLARKQLNSYWGQAATEQRSQVFDVQFKAWAADTVSAAEQRMAEMIRTGGVRGQDAFDYAYQELLDLRDKNLISDADLQTRMASLSQVIIRKGLTDEARRIHDTEGLAAALQYVASEDMAYVGAARTFMAGDELKQLVEHDIRAFHQLQQDEINEDFTKAWEAYLVPASQRDGRTPLSHAMIDDSIADAELRYTWHNRLFGYERSVSGGQDDQSMGRSILSTLEYAAYSRESHGGTGTKAYIKFYNPVTGRDEEYESTPAGYQAMIEKHWGEIAASPHASKIFDLMKRIESGDYGAWGVAQDRVDAIKDPEAKMRAIEYIAAQRARYPDATKDQIAEFLDIATTEKATKLRVMGRFSAPQALTYSDEDSIVQGIEDGTFKGHIGGDPRAGMAQPIAWQSKEALQSFEGATIKEVEGILEHKLEAGTYTAAWLPRGGPGNDGIYDYTVRVQNQDKTISTYRAVVAVTGKGKREAALLRQDYSAGGQTLTGTQIQDPANPKKFFAIDPIKGRIPGGWRLPDEAGVEAERVVSEAEREEQRKAFTVKDWPTAVAAYPAPPGFKKMEWNKEFSSLKARQAWYRDNGYLWDGKQFIKAEEARE